MTTPTRPRGRGVASAVTRAGCAAAAAGMLLALLLAAPPAEATGGRPVGPVVCPPNCLSCIRQRGPVPRNRGLLQSAPVGLEPRTGSIATSE